MWLLIQFVWAFTVDIPRKQVAFRGNSFQYKFMLAGAAIQLKLNCSYI